MKLIFSFILYTAFLYLLFSFGSYEINSAKWAEEARWLFSLFLGSGALFLFIIYIVDNDLFANKSLNFTPPPPPTSYEEKK